MQYHYINISPAIRLKTPRNRIPKIPTRSAPHYFIKPEIMQKIFTRFPERNSSFIPLKIAYECGLRLGETFALCWEDIDLDNKAIYINRQIQRMADYERSKNDKINCNGSSEAGKGYWYFSAPKYNSYRVIEIGDELTEILKNEKDRQDRAKAYYSQRYQNYFVPFELSYNGKIPFFQISVNRLEKGTLENQIHLICIRVDGSYITPRTMQHTTMIIKKEIFKNFDFHSLRHTHASMLAEIGVDQKYIQTRLGHTDICTTINVYECTTDLMRIEGRMVLNKLFH